MTVEPRWGAVGTAGANGGRGVGLAVWVALAVAVSFLVAPAHAADPSAIGARLLELKPGAGHPPVFCVQTLGGNVDQFRKLARHLEVPQPVYGLTPAAAGTGPSDVQGIAADLAGVIGSRQGRGPYVVCGFSSGGALALEVARRLDDTDSLVIMFDSVNPAIAGKRSRIERIRDLLSRAWYALRHKSLAELWAKGYDFVRRTWSYWGHEPAPTQLRVVLFQQRVTLDGAADATFGWGTVVGAGLTVEIMEGGHGAMLAEPLVAETAARLQERLSEFCARVARCVP